jgi:hypothetical protein
MNWADMPQPVMFSGSFNGPTFTYSSSGKPISAASSKRTMRYLININPKYMPSLRVNCTDNKIIELKGIDLH